MKIKGKSATILLQDDCAVPVRHIIHQDIEKLCDILIKEWSWRRRIRYKLRRFLSKISTVKRLIHFDDFEGIVHFTKQINTNLIDRLEKEKTDEI